MVDEAFAACPAPCSAPEAVRDAAGPLVAHGTSGRFGSISAASMLDADCNELDDRSTLAHCIEETQRCIDGYSAAQRRLVGLL